jgi:ABC-2 type transport system permease protein
MSQLLSAAKYSLLSFRRNPAATFFTIVFPLLFLVIFGFVFGNETVDSGAKVATFIVPGILGLSIVSATFVNLAMGQVIRRESGQLKRLRGTPLPALTYLGGQIIGALVIVAFMTVLVTVVGRLFFGVVFNWSTVGVFAISIALGSMAFSALGLALTSIIPSEDAAPAITNAAVFPLYFISDVFFFTDEDSTGVIARLGDFFPVKPLVHSLQDSYDPFLESVSIPWAKWAVVAGWGIFGVLIASRFFRWTPSGERR